MKGIWTVTIMKDYTADYGPYNLFSLFVLAFHFLKCFVDYASIISYVILVHSEYIQLSCE